MVVAEVCALYTKPEQSNAFPRAQNAGATPRGKIVTMRSLCPGRLHSHGAGGRHGEE